VGLSDSVDGLFGWMDDAEAAVVPGKRQVGKDRSFRAPTEESIECVLSWMDELASDAGERVVQAPRPKPQPAQPRPKPAQPRLEAPQHSKPKPKPKPRKPQHAKAKPKPTRRAARPQIMRELGPPPPQSAVVTGRRPQPRKLDDALTASEVWLLGSAPEVALGSDRGRTSDRGGASRPKPLREFTPPADAFGSASRAGAYRRPQPEAPPPVQQAPRSEPPRRPTQPRKVLSAEERRQAIERANGLVDWMSDLMRRWEESSEGEVMPPQPRALHAGQLLPPPPPPPPPLPSLATGRLRYDQVEDVFDRAKRLNQRVASFESELNKLSTPAPEPEPEPELLDEGSQLFGMDTDILYPNPMFETELCSVDPELEAQRLARPPARRPGSRNFDPRDPFDPLARDPFAQAGFDPFSPPDEERRAS